MGRAASSGTGRDDRIEFLTPRDSLFGGDSPAEFEGVDPDDIAEPDESAPRSRWLTGAATLAVVALVAGGVIAAAPWSADDTASQPPPSTDSAATSPPQLDVEPASVGVVQLQPETGLVFDPMPDGFAISAISAVVDVTTLPPPMGWGEVWATDDATGSTGSWFSVTLLPYSASTGDFDATRVALGGRVVLVSDEGDGVLRVAMNLPQTAVQQALQVRSSGLSFDELVRLAASVGIDDDRPSLADDRPVYTDPSLLDGYRLEVARATDDDLLHGYASGTAITRYGSEDDLSITIDVSPRDAELERLDRLTVGPLRASQVLTVPDEGVGEDMLLGASAGGSDSDVVVRWHTDDTTVSVRSTMPIDDLLQLLPTLRRTTPAEWHAVQKSITEGSPPFTGALPGEVVVSSGSLSDGTSWNAQLPQAEIAMLSMDDVGIFGPLADRNGSTTRAASFEAGTVVLALSPVETQAGLLRVTIGDVVVADAPMVDLGSIDPSSSFAARVGALAFEQSGPFLIELLDANGTVLDEQASPGYPT